VADLPDERTAAISLAGVALILDEALDLAHHFTEEASKCSAKTNFDPVIYCLARVPDHSPG